ncbi:MAG: hypothetical protein V1750_01770 [Acidobacteriota bacterium]
MTGVAVLSASLAPVAAQAPDPRTAGGQLEVCGGAASWRGIGYLEFEVTITTAQAQQGPWRYRWDRRQGYLRLTGAGADGSQLDVALDLGSRTGGGWSNGQQLTGEPLGEAVSWTLQRFGEDVVWLTFPLEWGAPGVTVTAQEDVLAGEQRMPAVRVVSAIGPWEVLLDPATGQVSQTVFERAGMGRITASWQEWENHAGVFFARRRVILETGETLDLRVLKALAATPVDAF